MYAEQLQTNHQPHLVVVDLNEMLHCPDIHFPLFLTHTDNELRKGRCLEVEMLDSAHFLHKNTPGTFPIRLS